MAEIYLRNKVRLFDFIVRYSVIMIDQLRQMAIFAKTIDHGSFRGAARELNLSPSVVSHHISQLETHLGVTLLYRSTRKLALTSDGERLLAATYKMLEAVEGELVDISGSANEPSGEIRFTVPSVLSASRLAKGLASTSLAYPRVKLTLDYSDVRKELIGDGFDIAVRMGLTAKDSPTTQVLFNVRRTLVCSRSYFSQRSPISKPKQLADWDWLLLSPVHARGVSLDKPKRRRVRLKPRGRIYSNDAQSLYHLAHAGAGLAVVPEFLAMEDIAAGRMVRVLPEWRLDDLRVFAEWPSSVQRHSLIRLLTNSLREFCGD